ncbi:hypothetical protein [Spirosoma fluminis]
MNQALAGWHNCFVAICVKKTDIYVVRLTVEIMTVIAVKLEDKVFQDLKEVSNEYSLPSDEMINRILKNYLHVEKINKLRRELKGTAEAAGFMTEEDIYREIS